MKFKSIGLVDLIRVLRAWWPRATRTLGDAHGFGSRYAEISFRLVWVYERSSNAYRLSVITCEESRGES